MCYYNGQRVTRSEFIRLKNLEKVIAKYSFMNRDLLIGFEYGKSAVLKKRQSEEDFDIVEMERGKSAQFPKILEVHWNRPHPSFMKICLP